MAQHNYTALNKEGKKVRGKISATNPQDLEAKIKDLGYELLDFKTIKSKKVFIKRRVKPKDMISFCVHMEELDRAGVPILDSLIDLRDSVDTPKMRDLLSDLVESIRAGDSLSIAISKKSEYFDDLFYGLIAVGEETGNIGDSFGHLSKHIKWQADFRRKIKKAITYPMVLMVVMTLVITIMMLFVVPQLVEFLSKQGIALPFYTRWLIAVSNFFVNYWWVVILFMFLTPLIIFMLYRKLPAFKYVMDKTLLRMPILGVLITKINLARFVKFFSITFTSGLGVLESLDISRKVVTNSVIKETIDIISLDISNGSSITEAIAARDSFPSLVVRMFRVGEESANIERALSNVNFFYEREIDDTIETMVAMIQPILLVVMGGMLMWIIASVFGPVYGSFSKMKF
jgi:type IV pilus assembly protein PilC